MKPKILLPLLVLIIVILYYTLFNISPREASMLLVNGIVYTVNEHQPLAEAVAIRGDKIVGVGTTKDIMAAFKAERVIDLKGRAVYPGFIDSHAHLENLGIILTTLNLIGTSSVDEIQEMVRKGVEGKELGQWLRGRGWDQNVWRTKAFPTHEMLDAVSGDVPVYLTRIDGHAVWVNEKVLTLAGISKSTPDPQGGKILRDKSGNPTGVFIDNAVDLLLSVLPEPTDDERMETVSRAVQECLKVGLTEVHDMGVDLQGIRVYKRMIQEGKFPFRVYAALADDISPSDQSGFGPTLQQYFRSGPETGGDSGRLTVRAIKLYADGALGSRGAALIEPYADDPGNRGLTLISTAILNSAAGQALAKGFQLCVHAIGDRANNIVLNVYEKVLTGPGKNPGDVRFRIEHAQVLDSADIPRFHRIGVLPMMQPTHCTSDMGWAEDRLGPRRVKGAYAWRSLIDDGSIVPGGSDFPVESPNPLFGIYAAITRQDQNGLPAGGWHPEQRMTREEALKSFTIWGAYAGFQEKLKGSLESGKWADLVVLSDDIMKTEPRKICTTTVEMTIIGGEIVYSSGLHAGVGADRVHLAQR